MAKATIKTFEGNPLNSEKAFHGGFQPRSKVQKGYQPQGSSDVPQSVPKLVSGVVLPSTIRQSLYLPNQLRTDTNHSPMDDKRRVKLSRKAALKERAATEAGQTTEPDRVEQPRH
jgi:hypothetical protein